MCNTKKLLIIGNSSSIHTNNLKALVDGYFSESMILDNKNFSLHSPLKLLKAIFNAKKLIKKFAPSFIILYQVDIAAFFIALINKKIPTLVVGIGSDILIIPEKSIFNKFIARYVINHGKYFNAGSITIKEKMQKLTKKNIDITIANLGTNDIIAKEKQNIIFSNRLHKDLYNIDKIINAFYLFLQKNERKNWKLIIAATGKEKELQEQAKNLGIENNIEFVGWLDKQQNEYYYGISKIWVSLAQSDSISISLLEAMSSECMPVCYDVPALKGFLTDNLNAIIVKDFNENFFERAFSLNWENITTKNRIQARNFSDKTLNRQRFFTIFDKEFKK